ncbi:MAG: hypothetical protein P8Y53_01335 [Pseudolabrys sp.]
MLLAIGASYERGGLAGLRDLTADALYAAGLSSKAPAPAAAPLPAPAAKSPSGGLAPDEVFWLSIKDSHAPGLFEEFLKKFPASPHRQEARSRLAALQQAPQPATAPAPHMPMRQHWPGTMMGHSSD